MTTGGAGAVQPGVEGITAVVGWIAALVGAWVGLMGVRHARRVSSDAKKAREQEEASRARIARREQEEASRAGSRADRDAAFARLEKVIETYERQHATREAEHDAEVAELRAEIQKRTGECDDLRTLARQQEMVLLVHVPWDYERFEELTQLGIKVPHPPPLRPPPIPREED